MSAVTTTDGFSLYHESHGEGDPIVFVHEFAGDHRSWAPQVRFFSRRYRCITFDARGYPPSDVPPQTSSYSQDHARDDILSVLDSLGIDSAHIVGLSMGAFAALHFGLHYPDRARSLVIAGCGYGAHPDVHEEFQRDALSLGNRMEEQGMEHTASTYGYGATRLQFRDKDPHGFAEFIRMFGEHSALGSANTMRGYQGTRPSLYGLTGQMAALTVPTLIMCGDEDEPAIDASVMMKRNIPSAGLAILPESGHTLNLEEPALFNQLVAEFLAAADARRWPYTSAIDESVGVMR